MGGDAWRQKVGSGIEVEFGLAAVDTPVMRIMPSGPVRFATDRILAVHDVVPLGRFAVEAMGCLGCIHRRGRFANSTLVAGPESGI